MKYATPILVAIVGFAAGVPSTQATDHTTDTPQQVKKALADDKAVLLDVREKPEWDAGHLKAARWLPLSDLESGIKPDDLARTLPKGKVVYCHCASGVRSLGAADLLRKFGYDVRPLKPGYKDLLKAGFEMAPR